MKHHGFLFTAPMVRAIMADPMRKSCTRRVVSPYNSLIDGTGKGIRDLWKQLDWFNAYTSDGGFVVPYYIRGPDGRTRRAHVTPRVQPGHWIYVKETWGAVWPDVEPAPLDQCTIEYKADLPIGSTDRPGGWPLEEARESGSMAPNWRSPLHMPKHASRAWLPVTRVGAGFVQSISEEDALAEGSYLGKCPCFPPARNPIESLFKQTWCHVHGEEFRHLWDSINGQKPGCSWAANPPCWDFHWEERREKPC